MNHPARGSIIFVTGTDTGVGKTVAAAWLAHSVTPRWKVALVKAVQTGADPLVDGDEAFYRKALSGKREVTTATLEALPEPLAPSIAARRAGRTIDFAGLVSRCREVALGHDYTVIEGSGGLLVSITEREAFADLAVALAAPLAVVLRPGLGTLNHTLLTVEAAMRRGLDVRMLICCGMAPDHPVVEMENLRYLRERFPSTPLISLENTPQSPAPPTIRVHLLGDAPIELAHMAFQRFAWDLG